MRVCRAIRSALCLGAVLAPSVGVGADDVPEVAGLSDLKPRFELRIPSVKRLYHETMRSHSQPIVESVRHMLVEAGDSSADGVDTKALARVVSILSDAPDAVLEGATFAPDLEGRARWVIAITWPVRDVYEHLESMLELDAAGSMFDGVSLSSDGDGGFVIRVANEPVGFLRPAGEARSTIASHADLSLQPQSLEASTEDGRSEANALLSARLNLTQTEHDSGATFFSSFSAVTAIDYQGFVNDDGDWNETVHISWPPISGMGAKALLGRVKQTFFVPDESFGAAVLRTPMAVAMLDGMAGLGPQIVMEAPGQMEFVGEPTPGPIAAHIESDVCFTILPGAGFLPAPDLLIQARTKHAHGLIKALRDETDRINALFTEREQPEPWHEMSVRDRPVFWSEPASAPRGVMMPFVMRPVLFTTTETDAKDREHSFLVLGLTTTDPGDFVERWLQQPRTKAFRLLPSERKSNGQVWIQWRKVYEWVSPYLNLALGGAGIDALLPSIDSMRDRLTEGLVTVKVRYSGLTATHSGPLPLGVALIPTLLAGSMAADESGSSDLARERLASQRLKLLYHHCRLFKKDIGRWPAEIGELDGYVDFAGHPELLELHLSAKKEWSDWFSGFSEDEELADDDQDDDVDAAVKTDLYVIEWSPDAWSLGFKQDTFEHLDRLYVDQSGAIHRTERVRPPSPEVTQANPADLHEGTKEAPVAGDDDDEEEEKE